MKDRNKNKPYNNCRYHAWKEKNGKSAGQGTDTPAADSDIGHYRTGQSEPVGEFAQICSEL